MTFPWNKETRHINKFEKVSVGQFCKDFAKTFDMDMFDPMIQEIHREIKLPLRATAKSAGYDFFSPIHFTLLPGETIKIPTGIRVKLKDDCFLMCAPRSGHGFKYRAQLDNTIGVIDADYYEADNSGHIFAKITNDGREGKRFTVEAGEGFLQGIILKYHLIAYDRSTAKRRGGFGSTNKTL